MAPVDPIAWLVMSAVVALGIVGLLLAPGLKRDNLRRQLGGGGSFGGIGAGFDVVWRPSAEEARAEWEAQIEMSAPAPTPGDRGRADDGRIVIDVSDGSARLSDRPADRRRATGARATPSRRLP